jgi:uncharacterized protein YgiB involved in biofilm formation
MHPALPRLTTLHRPVTRMLMPVLVGSGIAGFITGQFTGHLPHGLALTLYTPHQTSGQVQGALSQRVGAQVAHQAAATTITITSTARPRSTGTHATRGKGGHGGGHGGKGG